MNKAKLLTVILVVLLVVTGGSVWYLFNNYGGVGYAHADR